MSNTATRPAVNESAGSCKLARLVSEVVLVSVTAVVATTTPDAVAVPLGGSDGGRTLRLFGLRLVNWVKMAPMGLCSFAPPVWMHRECWG